MSEYTDAYFCLFHRDETKEIQFNQSNKSRFKTQILKQAGLETSMRAWI